MIERGTVGGTCVNTGCAPSRALLAAASDRAAGYALGLGLGPRPWGGAGCWTWWRWCRIFAPS